MAKTFLFSPGTLSAQCDLVEASFSTDPVAGSVYIQTFEGSELGCQTRAAELLSYGARVNVTTDGGKSRLVATFARDPSTASNPATEVPNDYWTLDWEMVQVSVWSIPAVIRELAANAAQMNPAEARKTVIDAASGGLAFPLSLDTYRNTYRVYLKLIAGAESFELKRPVLSRVRTYSKPYPSKQQIQAREYVYLTAQLVSLFSIPADVQAILPDDPGDRWTPVDVNGNAAGVWAWKLKGEQLRYMVALGKWEESTTWAFAAWDSDLYEVIS